MAFENYEALKASIAGWLHRDDLTDQIPDFIALAEVHLSDDITAIDMEVRAPFSLSAASQYITLPTDIKAIRRVSLSGDPLNTLKYATPDRVAADFPTATNGKPAIYTLIGGEMQIAPPSDGDYTLEVVYRQAIPALSDTSQTNWLLTRYPNAYLFGALVAAQFFIEDENKFAMIQAAYQKAIDNINSADWGTGSALAVRVA